MENKNLKTKKLAVLALTAFAAFGNFAPSLFAQQDKKTGAPQQNATQIKIAAASANAAAQDATNAVAVAPGNDNFANAQLLNGASGTVLGATNIGATKEAGEAAHTFNRGGHSIWYKYAPQGDGVLTIGTWFEDSSYFPFYSLKWGLNTDVPVLLKNYADVGYSLVDEAVFRPQNGTWYIYDTKTSQYTATQFGASGDKPVAADFDTDGRADVAVYRPSNGVWYVLRSSDNQFQALQFGVSTDVPQPADYDGDGKADCAVYRPANGTWYIWQSGFQMMKAVQFGAAGDIPVAAPNQLQ